LCKLCGCPRTNRQGVFAGIRRGGTGPPEAGRPRERCMTKITANRSRRSGWRATRPESTASCVIMSPTHRFPRRRRPSDSANLRMRRRRGNIREKLACQPGFDISFYDLSRPVIGPPFSDARMNSQPDHLRLADSLSTRPKGSRLQPQGAMPSEPHTWPRRKSAEGLGGNDAQARRAV
jgi:hypothetical protein